MPNLKKEYIELCVLNSIALKDQYGYELAQSISNNKGRNCV